MIDMKIKLRLPKQRHFSVPPDIDNVKDRQQCSDCPDILETGVEHALSIVTR